MTDLATTPGTEGTQPEDAALIDDPTSLSDADVVDDLDHADEAESDEADELEESDAITADDEADAAEADADDDDVADDEPVTADAVELDADQAEDVEASALEDDDEPAGEAVATAEAADDAEPVAEAADDAEPVADVADELDASDEDEDQPADEADAEAEAGADIADELEASDEDEDEPADESAVDVEAEADAEAPEGEDDVNVVAEAEDESAEEAVATSENEPTEDEPTDGAEPSDEVEPEDDAEPSDEVEPEDDAEPSDEVEPEDEAVTDVETDTEAESPEDEDDVVDQAETADDETESEDEAESDATDADDAAPAESDADDDTELFDDIEFFDDVELVNEPADLVDLDALTFEDEDADESTAILATVGAAAAATSAAATATAVLPAPATTAPAPTTDPSAPPLSGGPDSPTYVWAPAEPQPRKSRKPLWIGLGAGAAVIGLVVASLVLIAPGTSIAGVPVGFLTQAAATDAVQQRLATTTIVLTGEGGDAEVTGADLGASVDASGLAAAAFAAHPMWNVTAWFPASADVPVRIDTETANSALRAVAPELYADPVDATLAFDATTGSFVTTPSELGTGIDVDAVRTALQDAFASGETRVELEATVAPVEATTPTYVAEASAKQLNGILDNAGFYVGAERTVPVDRAVAASWLTVTPGERGTFEISADESAIEEVVATLPAAVHREAVNATVVTDSAGKVLRELTDGVSGRLLGDTSNVASEYSAQLVAGDPVYQLPVEETPFVTTTLERRIEVDLSAQTTYLFENDQVIGSYAISSGLPGTPTHTGSYRIFAHVPMQDMGALCYNPAAQNSYCTENVPWITYFNGDQGFHGTYWHNNFGNPMSHGCVNLPINTAKFLYDWAPTGTEVWVHA